MSWNGRDFSGLSSWMVEDHHQEKSMKNYLTVSDVARRLGVRPRTISDLFYHRRLSDKKCPIVGGRRMIPPDYVSAIEGVLRDEGNKPCAPTPLV